MKIRAILKLVTLMVRQMAASGPTLKIDIMYKSHSMIPNIASTNLNFLYNSERYLFTSTSDQKSKIYNITDMACYGSKELCLISGNRQIELYEISDKAITMVKRFSFMKVKRTLISLMKISLVPKSNYFLSGEFTKNGVMRWDINDNSIFSKMTISKIPQYLSFSSLHAFRNTRFAGVTFRTYKKILIMDFVKMEEMHKFDGYFGYLAYLDLKPSKSHLVVVEENRIKLMNYQSGDTMKLLQTDFYINDVKSVPRSGFTITANGDFIRIYDMYSGQPANYVYSINANTSLYSVDYNEMNKKIFFSGNSIAGSLIIKDILPVFELCSPLCKGCEIAFSRYGCKECDGSSVKKDGGCEMKDIDDSIGGYIGDYSGSKVDWSAARQEGYVEGVTWDMLVYVVVVIVVVVLLLICVYFGYVYVCYRGGNSRRRYKGLSKGKK